MRHPALLLVRGAPDGEDEDRSYEYVRDRVCKIEQLGRRVGVPYSTQPETPCGRGQRKGDDDAVEPDTPARRRAPRVAPEGANAGDRKRHCQQESGICQRRVRRLHPQPNFVDRPDNLPRRPEAGRSAHQRPAEPVLPASSSCRPYTRERCERCRYGFTDVVDRCHRLRPEVDIAKDQRVGHTNERDCRRHGDEGPSPAVQRHPRAHTKIEVKHRARPIHPP